MAERRIHCMPLAPGVAAGILQFLFLNASDAATPTGPTSHASEVEIARFEEQAATLQAHLERTAADLERNAMAKEAEIVRAHAFILCDEQFRRQVEETIRHMRFPAESAVEHVLQDMAEPFSQSLFPGLADRAADLHDLSAQLRRRLSGKRSPRLSDLLRAMKEPVLVLQELTPSVALEARRHDVRAMVVGQGTGYSHTAILARAFGFPVVRVADLGLLRPYAGQPVLVDADQGELLLHPDEQDRANRLRVPARKTGPVAGTLPVRIWASIVAPEELEGFDWDGVEGVGLYRTEALFIDRDELPSEDEQMEVYAKLFALCGDRPVTVRTLDIGADKPLSYLSLGPQQNPQFGLRAHRLFRYHPELLLSQVRAILRVAVGKHLRLLYPMIESPGQWQFVQDLTEEAIGSLRSAAAVFQETFDRGPLIEVPSAAWSFPRLLAGADFASVGTNDLVQYLFAVDRGNTNVSHLYRPDAPVVLDVLKTRADQAREAKKPFTLCGEIAADLRLLPVLIGLGIEDFSVAAARIPAVQSSMQSLSVEACRDLAARCLAAADADEVAELLSDWHGTREKQPAGPAEVRDPICQMALEPLSAPYSLVEGGRVYYFCSRRCRDIFRKRQTARG